MEYVCVCARVCVSMRARLLLVKFYTLNGALIGIPRSVEFLVQI
jgi:hypothetical protein